MSFSSPGVHTLKIVLYFLISLISVLVAIPGLLVLLLVLNGYSERHATPAIAVYFVLSFFVVIGSGPLSVLTSRKLLKRKQLSNLGASAITFILLIPAGVLLIGINVCLAVGVAELVRKF